MANEISHYILKYLFSSHLTTKVFLPAAISNELFIIHDNKKYHCIIVPLNNRDIAFLKRNGVYIQQRYDAVLIYHPTKKALYLIPTEDIYEHSTIALNSPRKDEYIIYQEIQISSTFIQ
ncbi:MAG: hypothetical protein ACTSXA_00605 [Candidatus Heimdallarchaeota archaeon]